MESDFLLNQISAEGREANARFERKLAAVAPLETILEVSEDADELQKVIATMERQFSPAENPWTSEKFVPADVAPLSLAELEKRYSAPENPWSKAAQQEPAAEPEDEREMEVVPDRADRHTRYVENMKSAILFKMQEEHMTRDAAVSEMLKIAGANTFSRQIIREAEQQTVNA